MGYTIDIDTGGTFTDGFFVSGSRVEPVKVPTTPHDLTICFLACIKAGAERFGLSVEDLLYDTDIIRFSNTIGTNTIIERDGSRIGLLVTGGREGLVPTGNGDGKAPLVDPEMVAAVNEKTSPVGEVLQVPDAKAVMEAAQGLIDRGARCLVVALTYSDVNPQNERAIRSIIKGEYPRDFLGSVPVFLSSDISSRSGEEERINAAVLNAYIHGKLVSMLYKAGEELRRRMYGKNLFVVHNNHAVARVAKTRAINTYNSGPAAGLMGARVTGLAYGADAVISADMGGTSFDLGYVQQGQVSYTLKPDVEGFRVNVPMVEIKAVGAGGGSIASVVNGALGVGPRSAGALPGPVCFDLGGTEPTVTDADLILGVFDPEYFLGGAMKLNLEKARNTMAEKVAEPLGLSVEAAALSVKETIDAGMGRELMKIRERLAGDADPLLVVYGGAGPAHCCHAARAAGIKKIVITPFSAVFSAYSASGMDVGHIYYARTDTPFGETSDFSALPAALETLTKEAERDIRGEGFTFEDMKLSLELLVQETGRGTEIKFGAPLDFFKSSEDVARAVKTARDLLGQNGHGGDLNLNMVCLAAQAEVPHFHVKEVPVSGEEAKAAIKSVRSVFLDVEKGFQEIPVYDRSLLTHGHRLSGPALVESEQTTVLVSEGWQMTVDKFNNAVLEEVTES
ncbi:MAG: hydantoinase/oxoprolinase family protein [Deltaproteobacteria bacterium]|jgi:N-methylhydantoinase A|nr:hydantoinase/oxoprolinase family protein [Deltaproteobacteria bacterium]